LPEGSLDQQKKAGKKIKKEFLKKTPAIKSLSEAVKKKAVERGYLMGLDKRKITTRSEHSALNFLLQSAGALVCKKWIVTLEELLQKKGFKHGFDGDYAFCAWIHDEVQIACRSQEVAEEMGKLASEAMTITEKFFDFKCPLAVDFMIGTNWATTH